jgi:hypothetical protein
MYANRLILFRAVQKPRKLDPRVNSVRSPPLRVTATLVYFPVTAILVYFPVTATQVYFPVTATLVYFPTRNYSV